MRMSTMRRKAIGMIRPGHALRTYARSGILVLALAAGTPALAEESILATIKANYQAADADDNGGLDPTEFRALIDANADHDIGRAAMIRRFGAYERAFKQADQDGDGSVTWTEIMSNQPK